MSIFYSSERIGKGGKAFRILKFKTLKDGSNASSYAGKDSYTRFGRFLRKTKLDELPALLNILKGEMSLFGYRPEEKRTWDAMSAGVRETLSKHKPGFIDLSSVHFFDEEKILQLSDDKYKTYWERIFPIKMALRAFWFENKCWPLRFALAWIVAKKMIKSVFKR